jgi:uncharacterized protein (DUF1499 family)
MSRLGWIAVVLGLLAAVYVVLIRTWPLINIVETGRTPEYPDIQPRYYAVPAVTVFAAALRAAKAMPRWTVSPREEVGEIRAEARTRMMRFVDDVSIRVTMDGARTRVDVRSASRIGRGDFGQNARRIRAFFSALDQEVAAAAPR